MKSLILLLTTLLPVSLTALFWAGTTRVNTNETPSTLFYQPSLLADRSQRFSAWSHSIAVRDGRMFNAVSLQQFGPDGSYIGSLGVAIAESDDGVHWRETDPFTCPLAHGLAGYCLRWTGKEFVYFSSERNQGADHMDYPVVLRQYRSRDLKNWEFMGDEYTTRPDKRWCSCRWDELVILDDGGKFYGYITSEPRPELARDGMGMLESTDGVRWEPLPPPVFEWDGLPSQQMEVCFCEKIGGRYYLGMGSRSYMGHLGFSVMMFVSESPVGPFRPDKETFRLCGSTTRDVNWLAKTLHWRGEILVGNWITTTLDKSFPGIWGNGQSMWIGPLKKLITDKHSKDLGRLHVLFRRENPTTEKQDFELLPKRTGKGVFVGAVVGVRTLRPGWWGEGEIKIYMDGDTDYPTICGTGSEDWVGLSYGVQETTFQYHGCNLNYKSDKISKFLDKETGETKEFNAEYVSMYRWHLLDPVYWKKDVRITMQQIGCCYYETVDDWSAATFWYEPVPSAQLPKIPDASERIKDLDELHNSNKSK